MRRDFVFVRGSTFAVGSIVRQADGTPIDLTGATLTWRLGTENLRDTKFSLTDSDDIKVTDATNGAYTITVKPAKTADLTPGFSRHQGEVVESDGTITTFLEGWAEITRDLP